MKGQIYFDGGLRPYPNGGFAYCFGWVVMIDGVQVDAGSAIETTQDDDSGSCGAEFGALNRALLCAKKHLAGADEVTIFGDSRAVIDLCAGLARAQTGWVVDQMELVRAAIASLRGVHFAWIPREQNGIADRLGRDAFAKGSGLEQRIGLMNRVNVLARRKFGNFYDKEVMANWSQEVTGKRKLASMSARELGLLISQVRNIPEFIRGYVARCNTATQAVPA